MSEKGGAEKESGREIKMKRKRRRGSGDGESKKTLECELQSFKR